MTVATKKERARFKRNPDWLRLGWSSQVCNLRKEIWRHVFFKTKLTGINTRQRMYRTHVGLWRMSKWKLKQDCEHVFIHPWHRIVNIFICNVEYVYFQISYVRALTIMESWPTVCNSYLESDICEIITTLCFRNIVLCMQGSICRLFDHLCGEMCVLHV